MHLDEPTTTTTSTSAVIPASTDPTSTAVPASIAHSDDDFSDDNDFSDDDEVDRDDIDDPNPKGDFDQSHEGDEVISVKSPHEDDERESVLRASAVTYLSGVVLHYLQKKFKCVACARDMSKENAVLERDDELFVHFKAFNTKTASDFGNLKVPSDEFRAVIDLCLTVFERQIKNIIYKQSVKNTIFDLCVAEVIEVFPNWFTECSNHKRFCVEKLILIKLNYELKIRIGSRPKAEKPVTTDQKAMESFQKTVRRKLFH